MAKKQEENGFSALKQSLKTGELGRLYIFSGEESYLRMHYLGECKKAIIGVRLQSLICLNLTEN